MSDWPRRRRVVAATGAAAAAALVLAVALRVAPVGEDAVLAREEGLRRAVAQEVDADAETLHRLADRLQASREFGSIVDGGGAEVRPARLFTVLGDALPRTRGWGAVFFDPSGRAVAWAGEAAGLEAERGAATAGLVASYHVTRIFVGWVSPRGENGARGVLVVTRRYPTGIIRPDVAEYLNLKGSPTPLRLRLTASEARGALLDSFVEPAPAGVAEGEVSRRRARPAVVVLALLAAALGLLARSPLAGLAAVRFSLLLAMPRGASGLFEAVRSSPLLLGLFETPADILLTGVLAAAAARALVSRRFGARLPRAVSLLGVPFAFLPWFVGSWAGSSRPQLFEGMSLVRPVSAFLEESGLLALSAAGLLTAAVLFAPLAGRRRRRLLAFVALACAGAAVAAAGGTWAMALGFPAAVLVAWALAHRAAPEAGVDFLSRAATAVFLVAGAALLAGAGLADGSMRLVDRALARAERSSAGDARAKRREAVARWEARVAAPDLEPWLPAGDRTHRDDLARALWVRGADESFPELGDTLTIRSPSEATISSFGVMRPGQRAPDAVLPVTIPTGYAATFLHVPWPRESDRDSLLSFVASRDVPDRVAIERLEWDASGRPSGARGESMELPPRFLEAARRHGSATGLIETPEGLRRMRVSATGGGFAGFAAPVDPRLAVVGAVVAAGEASLLLIAPLLLGWRPPQEALRRTGPRFFGTFRARLVALVVVFGVVPLAASVGLVRLALANHATRETARRARDVVTEGRRVLESGEEGLATSPEGELNRAAAVVGTDLLRYRDGTLVAASRALPVSASIARERLSSAVAQSLAEGRPSAVSARRTNAPGAPRVVEAAEALSRDGRDVLAVVVGEDEAVRSAADALVLLSVAVAFAALGLGGRAALGLGQPLEDLLEATAKVGEGRALPPLRRPENADLARLVDAFGEMSARVEERTQSLARERASAVGLLANLTAAVILFRRKDGAVLLSNEAADRILPGGSLGERLARPEWAPLRAAFEIASARPSPYETRVVVPGETSERLFRVAIVTLSEDVEEGRAILLLEDLTEFSRADRLAAWVDAARAIAHDIKNPLTPIRLAAERLQRSEGRRHVGEASNAEISENILRQVAILTERIGRLGRFGDPAALERQRLDAASARVLVEDVAADFRSHGLRVEVDVAGDLRPFAADPLLLRDALTNFLVNATEAAADRSGTIRISVSNGEVAGAPGVRFACEDDGPGVPEATVPRLFEPAFSTKSRGSGMGLAAVRRTAERHGGTVFARARAGGGLVIGFTLPALSSPP